MEVWKNNVPPESVIILTAESIKNLNRRMNDAYEESRRQWEIGLYGDLVLFKPAPKWRRDLRRYAGRVCDAWLVLIGKAEIYEG